MIRDLNNLYVAVRENKVIVFDTNLRAFIDKLTLVEPDLRNYAYYYREFKKSKELEFINLSGNIYLLQKVL